MANENEMKVGLTVDYDQFLTKINQAVASIESSSHKMTTSMQKMSDGIDTHMKRAAEATRSSTEKITDSIEKMKWSIERFGAAFEAFEHMVSRLGAILAGGAIFKEQLDASMAWLGAIKHMSVALGITAEEASVLQVALHKVGLSSEEYVGTATKITRQIANNSKEFEHFGIEAKNLDGTWKNGQVLITEVVTAIGRYAEGTSRQIALTDLLKRANIDINKYFRLTTEFMEEERKKAEELNLVFGKDKIALLRGYKDAMADFNLVMESASLNIMPTLMVGLTNFAVILTKIPHYLKDAWTAHKELWEVILGLIAAYTIYTAWIWAAGTATIAWTAITVGAHVIVGAITTAVAFLTLCIEMQTIALGALTTAEILAAGGWVVVAILAIVTAMFGWRAVVNAVIDVLIGLWNILVKAFYAAKALAQALTGDLAGGAASWQKSLSIGVLDNTGGDHVKNIQDKIMGFFSPKPGADTGTRKSGEDLTAPTRTHGGKNESPYALAKTAYQEAMAAAELEADLANEKMGFDKKLALYKQYLETVTKTEKEQHEYKVGLYHLESDAKKDQLEMDKALLDKEMAEGRAKTEEFFKRRIDLLQREVELTKKGSKERIAAEIAVINALKEHEKLMKEIARVHTEGIRAANLAEIDLEDQKNAILVEYGLMTQETLDKNLIVHEEKRYQIKLQALQQMQAAEKDDQVKYEQIQNQIDELTAKHVQARLQLENNLFKEQNSVLLDFKGKMTSAFDGMFQDIMHGTFNLSKFIQRIADDLLSSITKKLSKSLTDNLFGGLLGGGGKNDEASKEQVKQTQITAVVSAGEKARALVVKSGSMAAAAAGAGAATAMINANQAAFTATLQMIEAMGAAIGSIQPEGPLLAAGITTGVAAAQAQLAAAAATAQGSISASYATIGSAAGGAEIGYDRLLQVHKEELVLPASISGGLKNMIQAFSTTNQVSVPVSVNGGGFSTGFAGALRGGIEDIVMQVLQREAARR